MSQPNDFDKGLLFSAIVSLALLAVVGWAIITLATYFISGAGV